MAIPELDPARAREIAGRCGESIDADGMVRLGRAIAESEEERRARGKVTRVVVGWDARPSSRDLQEALVRGLASGGAHVVRIGEAPASLVPFAMSRLRAGLGVAITAGDRPLDWNGVRIFEGEGTLDREALGHIRRRALALPGTGLLPLRGSITDQDMVPEYLDGLLCPLAPLRERIARAPLRVVVAGSHGVASLTTPHALSRIGCRVLRLRCTVGAPEGAPTPDPSNGALLREVGLVVRASSADFGIVLGGDGDSFRVVDRDGEAVPDSFTHAFPGEDGTSAALRIVEVLSRNTISRNELTAERCAGFPTARSGRVRSRGRVPRPIRSV